MKRLIREIHKGKNLEHNLCVYETLAAQTYNDYAALELTFSAYTLTEEIVEEKQELARQEASVIERIFVVLSELGAGVCNLKKAVPVMRELRQEITDKMDLFTAYTDRLICYEYVLNRMEWQYMPAKELAKAIDDLEEETFLNELMRYVVSSKDQSVIQDKLHRLVGQIPVHMTKNKLFEKIGEAMTLYKNGDKASLDDFIYMLRTSAMVYEPARDTGAYPAFEKALVRLREADYAHMEEAEYKELVGVLQESAAQIAAITDFYYSLQKVVNGMYALCLTLPYLPEEDELIRDAKKVWCSLAKKEYREELLVPMEGRIEEYAEKTGYLESVLQEIQTSYKEQLTKRKLTAFFDDLSVAAKLLSDSLFIDLDRTSERETADEAYVNRCRAALFEELSEAMAQVSRPVKKAMMGKILEKLPVLFADTDQFREYVRVNLLGCQDKAEKAVVISLLREMMREEQEW